MTTNPPFDYAAIAEALASAGDLIAEIPELIELANEDSGDEEELAERLRSHDATDLRLLLAFCLGSLAQERKT